MKPASVFVFALAMDGKRLSHEPTYRAAALLHLRPRLRCQPCARAPQAHWLHAQLAQLLASLAAALPPGAAEGASPDGLVAAYHGTPTAAPPRTDAVLRSALLFLLHEARVEASRIAQAAPLLAAVHARERLKAQLSAFAMAATDPQRLFKKQVPGRLLREERRRRELTVRTEPRPSHCVALLAFACAPACGTHAAKGCCLIRRASPAHALPLRLPLLLLFLRPSWAD